MNTTENFANVTLILLLNFSGRTKILVFSESFSEFTKKSGVVVPELYSPDLIHNFKIRLSFTKFGYI